MTKKPEYEPIAAQYFIEMQMSVVQIAKRLNVSEKTIHNWKKAGEWEEKRKRYIKTQYSTNQTLYELLGSISKNALDEFRMNGTVPDQKTCYFIMAMTDKIAKLKQFEQQAANEKIEEMNSQNLEQNAEQQGKTDMMKMVQDFYKVVTGG